MINETVLQTFAVNNQGLLVHVDEVARGSACGCSCAACAAPVIARQGEVRGWHFAHTAGADCPGACESAIHLAAKEVVRRAGGITLPPLVVEQTYRRSDGVSTTAEARREFGWTDFDRVQTEVQLDGLRPDVLGHRRHDQWIVEIRVTHAVDTEKRERLANLGIAAIEVDLSALPRDNLDWQILEAAVVDATDNKTWLYCPDYSQVAEEALTRAEQSATQQPTLHARTKRRFTISGMYVDVTRYDFGYAVWSAWNPTVSPLVREIALSLGGKWKQQYQNWLVPTACGELLLAKLDVLRNESVGSR